MKINYCAKNYDISSKFKDIIEKKLEKLEKYFEKGVDVKINCSSQNNFDKLEITITSGTFFFRGESTSDNMYNNIDLALPKLERQITRVGDKIRTKNKKLANSAVSVIDDLVELPVFAPTKVAKTKRFELQPLSVEDAEAHMEALGHNFYIFLNRDTNKVNVVYKRNDNLLGVIEVDY